MLQKSYSVLLDSLGGVGALVLDSPGGLKPLLHFHPVAVTLNIHTHAAISLSDALAMSRSSGHLLA